MEYYSLEYYSSIRRNTPLIKSATWMNLSDTKKPDMSFKLRFKNRQYWSVMISVTNFKRVVSQECAGVGIWLDKNHNRNFWGWWKYSILGYFTHHVLDSPPVSLPHPENQWMSFHSRFSLKQTLLLQTLNLGKKLYIVLFLF